MAAALHEHGRALANLASLPDISLAGAVATATHGSGDANRCLAASVVGIDFVRADGEVVCVPAGEPDFLGSVVSLGALGVTTRLTLRTLPTFELRQSVWQDAPLHLVLEHFDDIMSSAYSVSLFSDPQRRD